MTEPPEISLPVKALSGPPAAGHKRAAILGAAVEEFQEHGFSGASMDRITLRAGVSKRTVYRYFASKEELFEAIVAQLCVWTTQALDLRYDPRLPIAPQLRALAWAEGRLLMEPEVLRTARMLMNEALRRPEMAQRSLARLDPKAGVRRFLAEAAATGALSIDDLPTATEEFLGLIKARAFWPLLADARPLTEAQMAPVIESTLRLMLARYAAPGSA